MNAEEDFFKFRDEHSEKLKKQNELNQEYQKFKVIDEERFRNRFAHKKSIKPDRRNDDPADNASASQTGIKYMSPKSNDEVMLQKLDVIQKNVEDLIRIQNGSNLESNLDTKNPELDKSSEHLPCFTSPFEYPDLPHVKDDGQFPHFGANMRREHSKVIEKEKYARELREQIEEKQRLRELERRKEREEDQIKLSEMREYGTLGHRLQENSRDVLNQISDTSYSRHVNYARGGNGIFGQPLSEAQKQANLKYRQELLIQIEEKKQHKADWIKEKKGLDIEDKESLNSESPKKNDAQRPDMTTPSTKESPTSRVEIEKHNAGIQVELEKKPQKNTMKPLKVVRKSPQDKKHRNSPQVPRLLDQIVQLKIGLAAEKLRVQKDESELEETIQVYDPRSIPLSSSINEWNNNQILGRPIKVQRMITAPGPPIKLIINQESGSVSNHQLSLDSESIILPYEPPSLTRSASVDSLHLEDINHQIKQRFEEYGVQEDLYKNEDPIIRDFMARLENSS